MWCHVYSSLIILGYFICLSYSADSTYFCNNHGDAVIISGVDSGRIITRVEGSQHYGLDMQCTWIIKAGRNPFKRIHISVIESDLQWTSSDAICSGKDFIDIRDGEFADSQPLAVWCGNMNPYSLISTGSHIHITFNTDDRTIYNERGITLKFDLFGDDECPSGYMSNGSADSQYCYSFKTHKETWTSAQQYCGKDQANLVSFENEEEASFITDQAKSIFQPLTLNRVWIGMNDIVTESSYKWIDDVPNKVKLRWYSLPHNNAVYHDCIILRTLDGFWEEEFCTEDEVQTTKKYAFICKRQKTGLTTIYPIPRAGPEKEGEKGTLPPKALIVALTTIAVFAVLAAGALVYLCVYRPGTFNCRQQSSHSSVRRSEEQDDNVDHPPAYDDVVKATSI